MVDRVGEPFDLKPQHLIGDTAYGTAEMLGWMVDEKGIAPHTPVWDKTERHDGTFWRSDLSVSTPVDSLLDSRRLPFHPSCKGD